MMKRRTQSLFFYQLILVVFCSCNTRVDIQHYGDFQTKVQLKSEVMNVSPVLLYPRNVFLCDDNLIVFNEKEDTLFRLFHLPEMTYQYGFGMKGEGPSDFNLPSIKTVSTEKDGFTMVDLKRVMHIRFNNQEVSIEAEPLHYEYAYFNGLTKVNDSLYCCDAGLEEDKEFMFLHNINKSELWGEYPETEERFGSRLARNQAYNKLIVAKPDGTKIGSFYRYARRFRIYDSSGKLDHDVQLDMLPGDELPNVESEKRYIHPVANYATDQYIYTLNLDMMGEEIGSRTRNPNIQVFTWEGVPIAQYELDHFISAFTVDEKENKIYGVFAEKEDCIYVFNIPG